MDTTYRFRFLIYLAAFMLVMSVCFVYAEPVPSQMASQPHLLFQVTPQHASFLASSMGEPTFDPADLRSSTAPVISPMMLQQLENVSHSHHNFLHRSRRVAVRAVPANSQSESSVLGLTLEPSASASAAR